ncbi:DNA polymerase Y family protein [Methylobacterium mesophilicum]|uniref:DNA polymerase Y family protein n=1 Tax=Methylobacterium mesophilicum TaxID=39956 RepID=UPI002F3569D4
MVPPGGASAALRTLPVDALRLDPGTVAGLKRLGLRRIGALDALPRGPLARRFGASLLLRLDQALARRPEPLAPLTEAADYAAARGFLDPIGRQSDIVRTARDLMAETAPRLERDGLGACALRLSLHRVDGALRAIDLGLSRPERDPERVAALVALRLDRLGSALDAGFGFETVALAVTVTGPMPARQADLGAAAVGDGVGFLADALAQRLGRALLRLEPRASYLPERGERGRVWVAGERQGSVPRRSPGQSWASPPSPAAGLADPYIGAGNGVSGSIAGPLLRAGEGWAEGRAASGSGTRGDGVLDPDASCPSAQPSPARERGRSALLHRSRRSVGMRDPRDAEAEEEPRTGASPWTDHLPPRPLVIFPRGEAACDVLSTVPEGPPRRFRWRARIHRVAHAEGPERIAAEWWREPGADRDYYRIECEAGHRLWLYRDGPHAPDRPAAWLGVQGRELPSGAGRKGPGLGCRREAGIGAEEEPWPVLGIASLPRRGTRGSVHRGRQRGVRIDRGSPPPCGRGGGARSCTDRGVQSGCATLATRRRRRSRAPAPPPGPTTSRPGPW